MAESYAPFLQLPTAKISTHPGGAHAYGGVSANSLAFVTDIQESVDGIKTLFDNAKVIRVEHESWFEARAKDRDAAAERIELLKVEASLKGGAAKAAAPNTKATFNFTVPGAAPFSEQFDVTKVAYDVYTKVFQKLTDKNANVQIMVNGPGCQAHIDQTKMRMKLSDLGCSGGNTYEVQAVPGQQVLGAASTGVASAPGAAGAGGAPPPPPPPPPAQDAIAWVYFFLPGNQQVTESFPLNKTAYDIYTRAYGALADKRTFWTQISGTNVNFYVDQSNMQKSLQELGLQNGQSYRATITQQ